MRLWRWFRAYYHLDDQAVCEASKGMGFDDYHTSDDAEPMNHPHLRTRVCKRCKKLFMIPRTP